MEGVEKRATNLPIEQLDVTVAFNQISDEIWKIVRRWPVFELDTIGKQLVSAMDSVAANIIEGGHRESDLDALKHFMIARGSAGEAANWLRRVQVRAIEPDSNIEPIIQRIEVSMQKLERLIRFRRSRANRRKPI